nr:PepSY domain-containing protein [Candidatus Atribacteria bacterium]
MKRNHYFVGILVALLISVGLSVAACAQEAIPEQPMMPEEPPIEEQPLVPEEPPAPERLPMDEAIKAALTAFPEAQAVSVRFADPLLGSPVYLIELSNGMEVKVDAQTGEVLGSEQLSEPSPAAALLPQTTVSLEQAV